MPLVVRPVDREPGLSQPLRHMPVAADVLPVSVGDRDHALELLVARWRPALPEDLAGAGTPKTAFLASGHLIPFPSVGELDLQRWLCGARVLDLQRRVRQPEAILE